MLCCQMPLKIPKHIVRLLLLITMFVLLGFAAKVHFTDPSFYEYGDYRADAVPELAAGEPLFKGAAYCQTCHTERLADWPIGAHSGVECEVCHGATPEHPDDGKTLIPADTIRLCMTCHEAMPARPARQPQIVLGEHPFPDEETPQCHSCHDPHIPGTGELDTQFPATEMQAVITNAAPASVPAAASKCAKCHGQQGEGLKKNPALAGSDPADFIEQMQMYKSGTREHKIMAKYAKSLSAEEITELASYYQSLPANPLNKTDRME